MKEKQTIQMFSALAHQSCFRIFRRLIKSGKREIAAGQLAREPDLPLATLSYHLKKLRAVGLIDDRRKGRSILYSLNPDSLRDFVRFLLEDCCNGREELCQPLVDLTAEDHSPSRQ